MKNARVLIPVFFNAPLGGLQSHVRAQCTALRKSGNHAVVMCKPGPFADILQNDGVEVLTTDYRDLQASIDTASAAGPYDLVHAHPFQSRRVGLAVAQSSDVPLVVTFHRNYLDGLKEWHNDADVILAVSPAIRDSLLDDSQIDASKLMTMPNGVDLSAFSNKLAAEGQFRNRLHRRVRDHDGNRPTIAFASRLDADKGCALDAIRHCWIRCIETRAFTVDWSIAGDGGERERLEREAAALNDAAGRQMVRFHGWVDEFELANFYKAADLAIGPGRCAMEAMACGTPAIAIGKNCYLGLVEANRFPAAVYTNFADSGHGGYGSAPEAMFDDIESVIHDRNLLQHIGHRSNALIRAYFDQNLLNDQLLSLYATLIGNGRRDSSGGKRRREPALN